MTEFQHSVDGANASLYGCSQDVGMHDDSEKDEFNSTYPTEAEVNYIREEADRGDIGETYLDAETLEMLETAENRAATTGRVLVITNISKICNIIQLLLLAKAHDFVPVVVASTKTLTSELSKLHAPFFRIATIMQLRDWLQKHEIPLLGIEIMDTAISVDKNPFYARIAFMPGNEGTGLSDAQKQACQGYVIIPHYGTATASLNVHIASCVVLYRYSTWAKERGISLGPS